MTSSLYLRIEEAHITSSLCTLLCSPWYLHIVPQGGPCLVGLNKNSTVLLTSLITLLSSSPQNDVSCPVPVSANFLHSG